LCAGENQFALSKEAIYPALSPTPIANPSQKLNLSTTRARAHTGCKISLCAFEQTNNAAVNQSRCAFYFFLHASTLDSAARTLTRAADAKLFQCHE
jgi:hypothetical protein